MCSNTPPGRRVAVFEAQQVGAGASGRTGGLVLEDTAAGPLLPGVEDCIATLQELVRTQAIACDLHVDGCWEIGRRGGQPASPLRWTDHGTLQVVNVIPGGAFDPRKFLAGLAVCIQQAGGQIFEHAPVAGLHLTPRGDVQLTVAGNTVEAGQVVFATNAFCLSLLGLHGQTEGVRTDRRGVRTAAAHSLFNAIGWATRTPFYTLDLPYLWGRITADGRIVMGAGLTGRGTSGARVDAPDAVPLFDSLEHRIRGLHPALRQVRLTHRWIGPLCVTEDGKPIITSLGDDDRVLLATGYHGHGVALSVRVGKLLAQVLAGQGSLPAWSYRPRAEASR